MSVRIEGASVVVTGASGGLGGAICRELRARGAGRLVLSARRGDVLERLGGELGGETEIVVADLAEPGDVRTLAARAEGVDLLVANAALPASGEITSYTAEQVERALRVNLHAPIELTRLLLPGMVRRGRGHVVLMSSLAGKGAAGGAALYSATKFGLRGFGFAVRDDLRGTGVGVTTVFPGFVSDAGLFADSGARLPRGLPLLVSSGRVARALVDAAEADRAEVDVAPLLLRWGTTLWGLHPALVTALSRRLGGERVSRALADGQRAKR